MAMKGYSSSGMKGGSVKGMDNGASVIGGSVRSSAYMASKNDSTGNYGKPIGDSGSKSSKGNSRTRVVSDRYK